MVYLVCPECGMVGYRIRPNSLALHPIYKKLHQEYVCQNCGTTLRRCEVRGVTGDGEDETCRVQPERSPADGQPS
jgi:coenzyme F420-reducing hydrogenase gamma subunit